MTDPIWANVVNVVNILAETEALLGSIERSITAFDFGRFHIDVEDWTDESLDDEHGWLSVYYVINYRVFERMPRPASRGRLAFAISFYRDEDEAGDAWDGAKRAKLYAGFAPTQKSWEAATLVVNGAGRSPEATYLGDGLWGTMGKGERPTNWFFAVALDAISSRADFAREVLSPVSRLLNGDSASAALQDCSALLRA